MIYQKAIFSSLLFIFMCQIFISGNCYAINVSSDLVIGSNTTNDFYIENKDPTVNLTIGSGGSINGTVSGAGNLYINNGVNNINLVLGKEDESLSNTHIRSGSTLTLSLPSYVVHLLLDNGATLNLNSGSNVTGILYGSSSGTININANYNISHTTFGISANKLETVNVSNNINFGLANEAYINNLKLAGNGSILELNAGAKMNGTISGTGTVNINTDYNTTATIFGTSTDKLGTVNVSNNINFGLVNEAYINNLKLTGNGSILELNAGAKMNGTISGAGTVNINADYDVVNTIFGTSTDKLSNLKVSDLSILSLKNTAYIDNLRLETANSSLMLYENALVHGTIFGEGTTFIGTDYNDTNTMFGSNTNSLERIYLNDSKTLSISKEHYVNEIILTNGSVINLNSGSLINGTINGVDSPTSNGTVNVNSIYKTNYGFGSNDGLVNTVNISNGNGLYLGTSSYIDKINIIDSNSTASAAFALIGDGKNLILHNPNGISFDANGNFVILISLNNVSGDTNNVFMKQLHELSQKINNPNISSTTDLNITNNNLYLNVLSKTIAEGTKILIDTSTNADKFATSSFIIEDIFRKLNLETVYNKDTSETELYLAVEKNRFPTTDDISVGAITSSQVLNNGTFLSRDEYENTLINNLVGIENNLIFFNALENLAPDASGFNIKMPIQSINSALSNVDKRLDSLRRIRFDSLTNNYNVKNFPKSEIQYYDDYFIKPYFQNNVWFETFGGIFKQNTKEKVFGYDADYYGGTIGYDIRPSSYFIMGTSYTFSLINADGLDNIKKNTDKLKISSNSVDLYFMLYNRFNYLTLNIGGGLNIYESTRNINFSNFSKKAKANYNGYSYYGDLEYGFNIMLYKNNIIDKTVIRDNPSLGNMNKPFKKDKTLSSYTIGAVRNFILLTPKISISYNNIMVDDFIEKGADAANLSIETEDYFSLNLNGGLSLIFSRAMAKVDSSMQFILNANANYIIQDNDIKINARYIDGNNELFTVYGIKADKLTYNAGVGLNFNFFDRMNYGVNYDFIFSDDFSGHMVKLNFIYNF